MSRFLNCVFIKLLRSYRFFNSLVTHRSWMMIINWHVYTVSVITYFILVLVMTTGLFVHYHSISNKALFTSSSDEDDVLQCRFPQLSLDSYGLAFALPEKIRPVCRSWFTPVLIENYAVRLIVDHINCTAFFYMGQGDRKYQKIPILLIYNMSVTLLSDYFTVQCHEFDTIIPTAPKKFYPRLPYASIRYDHSIRQRLAKVNKKKDDFNVLVLGFDGISRLQFERMLPKTFAYVTQELSGIVLKGYNIVGDGTPQQLIPMLTGMKETELPTTLYRDINGSFVDIYPFIWNDYHKHGYVTGYNEDRHEYGIWTLRLKGFRHTPTDHYMSPFYHMSATESLLDKRNTRCIGNQTSYELFLSYIHQFWSSYPMDKKFFFSFFKQFSHDGYTDGTLIDEPLFDLLRGLKTSGELERTVILLMTDHGARFSAARQSPQGKLEERLPFMSLILPPNFRRKYPQAIDALRTNVDRLTTPFDIYATLVSLLDMNKFNSRKNINISQRAISLFNTISSKRTCDNINLEPHWCSCLQWIQVNITDKKVEQAARHIVSHINSLLTTIDNVRCHRLQLDSIRNAQMYRPNKALLSFSSSIDLDGRVPAYQDESNNIVFYQLTFETKPNGAIYEATTQYASRTGGFSTDLAHISRLNAYKSSAQCIERSYSHLRKFCSCIQ